MPFGVQALVGDDQFLDHSAVDDGFLDNPRYILGRNPSIPNSLWVDDDGGPVLALVKATGLVGSHGGREAPLSQRALEQLP